MLANTKQSRDIMRTALSKFDKRVQGSWTDRISNTNPDKSPELRRVCFQISNGHEYTLQKEARQLFRKKGFDNEVHVTFSEPNYETRSGGGTYLRCIATIA